jgi:hypothetical protein
LIDRNMGRDVSSKPVRAAVAAMKTEHHIGTPARTQWAECPDLHASRQLIRFGPCAYRGRDRSGAMKVVRSFPFSMERGLCLGEAAPGWPGRVEFGARARACAQAEKRITPSSNAAKRRLIRSDR